ncbi:hypothetical protein PR202_ga22210 [Eleusine coracana subsp. coracana]|uniref:Uncharacterized protein n=1 Tax=Eleusine coracana subsp. coracana TaxID=191504 RepID=A0AAV5D3N5_ELECO|nr:hypothetical protein PR202_ga22210 [Eleusine coracana subsp. coracana]
MKILTDELIAIGKKVNEIVPENETTQVEEFESYLGCSNPDQIDIHPPSDTCSRGKIKRIKGHRDKGAHQKKNDKKKKNEREPRMCKACKHVGLHDSRNCPNKAPQQ